MNEEQAEQLVKINGDFYRTFASPFAQSRERLQPGVKRLLATVPSGARILDLGCGSAQTARWLAANGRLESYAGWDASAELLQIASARTYPFPAVFRQADLLSAPWQDLAGARFDRIFLFAVLHHIPGFVYRERILRALTGVLADGGQVWMSNWQFLRDPKYAARILPWGEAAVDESKVEPGDYLLDWRMGGRGLRYVHILGAEERTRLASAAGFIEWECFEADGKGERGSDYSVWGKA
jgi:SAM-dependent methyltransferase